MLEVVTHTISHPDIKIHFTTIEPIREDSDSASLLLSCKLAREEQSMIRAMTRIGLFSIASSLLLVSLRGQALASVVAPEIDPSIAVGGLAALAGVVLLVGQRLRRRR